MPRFKNMSLSVADEVLRTGVLSGVFVRSDSPIRWRIIKTYPPRVEQISGRWDKQVHECMRCGRSRPIWWTSSEIWGRLPRKLLRRDLTLCPRCFSELVPEGVE